MTNTPKCSTTPKTADGVDFVSGMTVYLPIGDTLEYRTIITDPAKHTIESFVYDGLIYNTIVMTSSGCTTDISFLYSTPAAFFNARAARLRLEIAGLEKEAEQCEAMANLGS